jgi:hypothetical protein
MPDRAQSSGEVVPEVVPGVVGEDGFDLDGMSLEEGLGSAPEPFAGWPSFVGQRFAKGQPRVGVDGGVDEIEAQPLVVL